MPLTKDQVISALGNILSYSISNERGVKNRVIGFTSEDDFDQYFHENYSQNNIVNLGGFWLCSTVKGVRPTESPVVWGFLNADQYPRDTIDRLIETLLKLNSETANVFTLTPTNIDNWQYNENENPKITPQYTLRKYSAKDGSITFSQHDDTEALLSLFAIRDRRPRRGNNDWTQLISESLDALSLESLIGLYADRYLIDFELTYRRERGIPTDIDRVTFNANTQSFTFLEIKEKDLTKGKIKGFGVDLSRLKDIDVLSNRVGMHYNYIVRHVKDQDTREFIEWKFASFKKFNNPDLKDCMYEFNGGRGMLPEGADRMTRILCKGQFGKF